VLIFSGCSVSINTQLNNGEKPKVDVGVYLTTQPGVLAIEGEKVNFKARLEILDKVTED
jgi:hypothetical protein